MKFLKQIITAAFMVGALTVGALADVQKNDQKPPKKPEEVQRPEKQPPPPPRNDNRGRDEGRDRGDKDNRRGRP